MTPLKEILKTKDAVMVDVRTPLEYKQEHVPGARNIPIEKIGDHIQELKKMQKPIVLYCMSGARSAIAIGILMQGGLSNVYNGGGIQNVKLYLN